MILFFLWVLLPYQEPGPDPADWLIEKQEWVGKLDPQQPVMIKNPHGTIRVRASANQDILVSGMIQRHKHDPQVPRFEHQHTKGRLQLTVVIPAAVESVPQGRSLFSHLRRLDLTVYLPAGSPLKAVTNNQLFEGKGLRNDLIIETGDGPITAFTSGSVDAKTYRGTMDIRFTNSNWLKHSQLITSAGEISVRLKPSANLDIDLQTRGFITTDFSLKIERHPEHPRRKTAKLSLGQDGKKLTISAGQGAVQLLLDL